MKNPRKRPLLSTGTSNKYSGGRGDKIKRTMGSRPPPPKSVAMLESLLDGAMKQKRKLMSKRSSDSIKKSKAKENNVVGERPRKASSHAKTNSNGTSLSLSETNVRDRWSHVDSKGKKLDELKPRINPFLEAERKRLAKAQSKSGTKILGGKETTANMKRTKVDDGREKLKRSGAQKLEQKGNKERKNSTGFSIMNNVASSGIPNTKSIVVQENKYIPIDVDGHLRRSEVDIDTNPAAKSTANENMTASNRSKSEQATPESFIQSATPVTESVPANDQKMIGSSSSSQRPKLSLRMSKPSSNIERALSSKSACSSYTSRISGKKDISRDETHERKTSSVYQASTGISPSLESQIILDSPRKAREKLLSVRGQDFDTKPEDEKGASSANNFKTRKGAITTRIAEKERPRKRVRNQKEKTNINDNFVRLNMKNNAGACRGARNKSNKFGKERRTWSYKGTRQDQIDSINENLSLHNAQTLTFDDPLPPTSFSKSNHGEIWADDSHDGTAKNFGKHLRVESGSKSNATSYVSKMSGLDPLDEFVDGTFHAPRTTSSKTKLIETKSNLSSSDVPKCARHQRPCKIIKVKKTNTGNKGREFYACSMPRGEQCDHFQWADDTVEAARNAIAKNSSYSNFIRRQVASYVDRFRTLTVPELREETARRGLNKTGKKEQLLMRLAIWTRDELVKCSPDDEREDINVDVNPEHDTESESIDDSSCSSEESSDDELEFLNHNEENEVKIQDEENEDKRSNRRVAKPSTEASDENGTTDDLLSSSLFEIFGHGHFRNGQEWAIKRCLKEKRSLLVAPTGFGKSLCYALPAALMDGVTVVVSPLISLIQDQLRSLPPRIPAATLSGSVSASGTAAILDDIIRKRIKILFVSPERLTSPAFRRLFNSTWNPKTRRRERKFPTISLLCIDEAHCISQWAHNFRPCFLRFEGFLKIMEPKSVLAITATAGPRVISDIMQTLGMNASDEIETESSVSDESSSSCFKVSERGGIKIIRSGRDNIDVMGRFMASQEERLAVVAGILTKDSSQRNTKDQPYAGKLAEGSVIVYVWRQKDTEVVAESLLAAGIAGGIVVYHGGMDASARAKSQNKFMRGKARICVATVAFGLGIDKADIVGIIHLYLSNSPEHYLQEIGRAGRDGRSALAIALPLREEAPTRHSLAFSNLVSKSQIRALLRAIRRFILSAGKVIAAGSFNPDRILHVSLPIQKIVQACDCKPETIETFISLIERIGGNNPILQIEGYNYDNATIAMKRRTIEKLAEIEPVALSIQAVNRCIDAPLQESRGYQYKIESQDATNAFQKQFLAYSKGSYSFSISQCANHLGPTAEPRHVFAALRRLQSSNELEFVLDTSETGRVLHLKILKTGFDSFNGDAYNSIEGDLVDSIFESVWSSSNSGASKVLDMHYILDQVAYESTIDEDDDDDERVSSEKSPSLNRFQELTKTYFQEGLEGGRVAAKDLLPSSFARIREKELKIDALSLLRDLSSLFQQNNRTSGTTLFPEHLHLGGPSLTDYTALAITKFLHGMDTPRTPIRKFRQFPMFGKWKDVDFRLVHASIRRIFEARVESA